MGIQSAVSTRGIRIWDDEKKMMFYPYIDEYIDSDIGIEDRDGVKIYEHDIIEGGLIDPAATELYFVIYNPQQCRFCLAPIEYLKGYKEGELPEVMFAIEYKDKYLLKVIGNIYKEVSNV